MVNQHIEDYLKYFINLSQPPGYAVMLNGEWGSGKTWFIKKFIEDNKEEYKFIYISLYGISSLNDIDDQVFQQLHPVLSSRPMMITGKIVKSALRLGLRLDLDDDGKPDANLNVNIPDLKSKDSLRKYILVFDDLERSSLEIEKALGYINSFVEQEGLKSIVLAYDEKIDSLKYKEIKEKTIGKSLKIKYDIECVFDEFINKLSSETTKNIISKNKSLIISIFETAGYRNLRHLYQTLLDFEYLLQNFEDMFIEIDGLMKDTLELFCIFSFEIKKGTCSAKDIQDIDTLSMARAMAKHSVSTREEKDYTVLEVFDKYDLPYDPVFSFNIFSEILEVGHIEKSRLTEVINSSKYLVDDSSPEWKRLWHFRSLEDSEFKTVLDTIIHKWENYEYKVIGEILHISGMFLYFSKASLFDKKENQIVKYCKDYIKKIIWQDTWDYQSRSNTRIDFFSGWEGLGIYENDNENFIKIKTYLYEEIDKYLITILPKEGLKVLDLMKKNPDELYSKFLPHTKENESYTNIPVFSKIDKKEFMKIFLDMSNTNKKVIVDIFQERYEHFKIEDLTEELKFLKFFSKSLKKEWKTRKGKITGFLLKNIQEYTIDKAISKIEKYNSTNKV